jgi:hypothetical protein
MPCPMCKKNHSDTLNHALDTLAATGKHLDRIVARLNPKQAQARPAPGKWSARKSCATSPTANS